jgi:hypothetical protein
MGRHPQPEKRWIQWRTAAAVLSHLVPAIRLNRRGGPPLPDGCAAACGSGTLAELCRRKRQDGVHTRVAIPPATVPRERVGHRLDLTALRGTALFILRTSDTLAEQSKANCGGASWAA